MEIRSRFSLEYMPSARVLRQCNIQKIGVQLVYTLTRTHSGGPWLANYICWNIEILCDEPRTFSANDLQEKYWMSKQKQILIIQRQ